jgi:hypothetical protein
MFKKAFSKENAKLWLYFIPVILIIVLAGVIFVYSL